MGVENEYPKLFPRDHTHTNREGADVVAQAAVNGLSCMGRPLVRYLNKKGRAVGRVCS